MSAAAAKKGVGLLKSSFAVLSSGFNKAKKEYASSHEVSVLAELRQKGLSPSDLIFQALQRLYFLYLAGYKHELVAASQLAGKRLTDSEKSTAPLDVVSLLGNSVSNECKKYGDFEKGKFYQSMQDILNKSRVSKDHFDRDSIAHDIYYAVLFTVENYGSHWQSLEKTFRDSASQVIAAAVHVTDRKSDPREKAAKAMYIFAEEIKTCSSEAEIRRQKAVKEAEELLKKEREKQMNIVPVPTAPSQMSDERTMRQR
ncbi:hypothetical protein SUGI_0565010 [Cryptomeria japonica]|uniref:uncharacterized protein LOC131062722 n=1 Tax=Cryptomeria japonica TaxID=3369 RepID=UPI002408D965|nr:uncharacterized protein LOC131062722 [Cryptomeria japonica]GLJ28675.1 hypothetical protein SUGI_0565010 [Cryptomeria japonica]